MPEHKIVLFGGREVGKIALLVRFVEDSVIERGDPTVNYNFSRLAIVDGKTCFLELLRSPHEEEDLALRDQYARTGEGFLLVYSITSRSSFDQIPSFREKILHVKNVDRFPLILVGTKCDLNEERQVTTEEGQNLAQSFGCPFLETSAITPINVELAFVDLVREIRRFDQMNNFSPPESKKNKKDCLIM